MTLRRTMTEGARELGIALSDAQTDSFLVYLVELEKWNRKISLTSLRDEQDIVVRHFLDSLSYRKGFTPGEGTVLIDMGSGAGFPALPLKIVFPDIQVTLIESVNKKASFLRHIVRTLAMTGVEVEAKRTDQLPASHHGRYEVVTARAFASMDKALIEGLRFLRHGGKMVLSRGPEERIEPGLIERCGYSLDDVIRFSLPLSGEPRALWVFSKI